MLEKKGEIKSYRFNRKIKVSIKSSKKISLGSYLVL